MIHSLFLVNSTGDIFLEKHWKSVVSRSVCDYFFEAQERASEPENVQPVIPTPHHYLINVLRHRIYFVAVIQSEVPPLFVIEFLHRVVDTFQDYFGVCSEASIKDNVVVVYELLEEMLDNGFPLATESNILKELIKPPTILRTVVNTITEQLPTGQLSVVPWRRTGVKYTNNEAYFDVVEEIDAIIDKSGSTITAEIQGVIDACVKLTGMPDLTLSFMNPRLLDDVSFHPCVRFKRWEAERILSFIPPDGNFRLLSYHVSSQNSQGRFDLTLGPKQTMGKAVESVLVSSQLPRSVLNASLNSSQGTYTFDPVTKINPQKLPSLKGTMCLQAGASKPDENPTINIQFKIQQMAISGLKVNRLDMYGEKYKPFKGIKYMTKAGKFQRNFSSQQTFPHEHRTFPHSADFSSQRTDFSSQHRLFLTAHRLFLTAQTFPHSNRLFPSSHSADFPHSTDFSSQHRLFLTAPTFPHSADFSSQHRLFLTAPPFLTARFDRLFLTAPTFPPHKRTDRLFLTAAQRTFPHSTDFSQRRLFLTAQTFPHSADNILIR
ncbi:AP-3 complex subunit mu-2 [Bagarius yarrelli]|uniref:AP-3 complex subunit mu-2 n=1 Tax=Bagarius yarrelli TaxID=175774 RepID=A0A556VWQ5_BAGYA|nr:AP-3 complex subunit mu-2 [Bagarius yarrelli]